MRISYTPEQEELRRELRSYFTTLMTPERREALSSVQGEYGTGNVYRETVAQMGKDGWLTLNWPKEYGGQDRSPMDSLIFTDEAAIAGAPVPFLTINSVAPTIMAFGTDEQKKFFLPKIAAGDLHFSIGYSEPECRHRPGQPAHHGGPRRRRLRDQRPEDVDQPDRLRGLGLAGGAHQPRGQEAPRHFDAGGAHHRRGFLLDAGAHHGRSRHQRHLLHRRARAGDQPGRRGERRLEAGDQPAQPRAGRTGVAGTDLHVPAGSSGVGAEHQGRRRRAADRLGVGAAQPGPGARQGRGAQADQLGAGVVAKTKPCRRRMRRPPRCSGPSWPPRHTGC